MTLQAAMPAPSGPFRGRDALSSQDVSELPAEDLDQLMGPERSRKAAFLTDWLIRHARKLDLPADTIVQLCERLVEIGLPLDRYSSSTETLDAEHDAIGRLWLRGKGVTERIFVRVGAEEDPRYLSSPFYVAAQTRRWLELWLPETDDSAFGIVPELKADGFVHYICVPIFLMNETNAWVTFATRHPDGFSVEDIAVVARIIPSVAILIDVRSTWVALHQLLRTYVGDGPHRAILRGKTKRGQISTIKSAMLFADMRDSVGHTAELSASDAVEVFNALFDCLVPPIEGRRGEVLKYIGDGLLAIFRESTEGTSCDAADRALAAAEEAFRMLRARNLEHPEEPPIHIGIALHYGEAAYGNVGSGVRLDFTVIGKDVGMASRIANMNRPLDEPLLLSEAFARRLRRKTTPLGSFAARGFKEPVKVFRPDEPGASELERR